MKHHPDLMPIPEKKLRDVTFSKRKKVILKKAIELASLCDLNICLFIQDANK